MVSFVRRENQKLELARLLMSCYNLYYKRCEVEKDMANNYDFAKLVETKLWKYYESLSIDDDRRKWIKDVYFNAVKQLTTVRDTFSNYTLHDETHVINVMEAIAGLLGNQIRNLTAGEAELLILAACLHDIGMVYTLEDKMKWLKREAKCNEFIKRNDPDLIGLRPEDWNDGKKQNYFRWLHPFRLPEVLNQAQWSRIFNLRPKDIVSKQTIIAVCQAHGEEFSEIDFAISKARDVDVLFCAMMLRIGDLLDFDDSRVPQILYSFAEKSMKSQEEWNKHSASIGFNYPESPSTDPLPYAAECFAPGVEHSVRNYLKWVDDELSNCRRIQNRFHERWRSFPIPYEIDKDEIESVGYETGDFKLTMAQDQIVNLLVGENLYDRNDIFLRELLQNSIDATLLRAKMEPDFQVESEDARIDLWEWFDENGNIWFRIDDRGIGMTKGMLQRYFLKIGNSYYNSDELKRDMRDPRQENYNAISRFGIGFLSCFLCGKNAEVSTLYFDPEKSKRENENKAAMYGYGIRMNITGLTDYYIMANQASGHAPFQTFPIPKNDKASVCEELEMDGYRQTPGTSIAVCIDPGKLGGINLRETATRYLCSPQMPVYYNGDKIGETYKEFMEKSFHSAGTHLYAGTYLYKVFKYEISGKKIGQQAKTLEGQIEVTVQPVNLTENHILEGLSGVIVSIKLSFNKDFMQKYSIGKYDSISHLGVEKKNDHICISFDLGWSDRRISFNTNIDDEVFSLINFIAPKTFGSALIDYGGLVCAYHGMFAGLLGEIKHDTLDEIEYDTLGEIKRDTLNVSMAIIFLENALQPKVDLGRTRICELHLSSISAICSLFHQLSANVVFALSTQIDYSLAEWRKLRELPLGSWLSNVLNCNTLDSVKASAFLNNMKYSISKGKVISELGLKLADVDGDAINNNYILAYFQDTYELTIDYMQGQTITLSSKTPNEQMVHYDLFPPMMFCKAKDDNSRRYICCERADDRKGITADHPYIIWLLNNAFVLSCYFNRQFKQIVNSLCNEDVDMLIQTLNSIRNQLRPILETRGIDMSLCPKLSKADFWRGQTKLCKR